MRKLIVDSQRKKKEIVAGEPPPPPPPPPQSSSSPSSPSSFASSCLSLERKMGARKGGGGSSCSLWHGHVQHGNGNAPRMFSLLSFLLLISLQSAEENKVGYFWHIDSLHLDRNYTTNGGDRNNFCWRVQRDLGNSLFYLPPPPVLPPPELGPFGDYLCDSTPSLVESTLKFMKAKMGDQADFIVWTGNSVPQNPSFPAEARLSHLSNVTDLFRLHFPYTAIYPALGNLDFFPHEDEASAPARFGGPSRVWPRIRGRHSAQKLKEEKLDHEKEDEEEDFSRRGNNATDRPVPRGRSAEQLFLAKVTDMWDMWLPPKAIASLRKGGYYTIELANRRLRLVVLNTNLYLTPPEQEQRRHSWIKGISIEESWRWLNIVMEDARRKRQNVLLFGHAPPGKFERGSPNPGGHWFEHQPNRRFVKLVRQFADVIVGQFFGHQHTDSFRVFSDDRGRPISFALLAPSVSPYKRSFQVGLESFSSNPAVRLYRYNAHTGEIFDYAQYYLDLTLANARGVLQWRLEYNFTQLYNLPFVTINPHTMDLLSQRLARNESWFTAYYAANLAGYPGSGDCSQECRQLHKCAIANVDLDDFHMCATQAKALSANQASPRVCTPWFLIILAVIICRFSHAEVFFTQAPKGCHQVVSPSTLNCLLTS